MPREMDNTTAKLRETWDRLVLLLITHPREGWEQEFQDITRREIERLYVQEKRESADA